MTLTTEDCTVKDLIREKSGSSIDAWVWLICLSKHLPEEDFYTFCENITDGVSFEKAYKEWLPKNDKENKTVMLYAKWKLQKK